MRGLISVDSVIASLPKERRDIIAKRADELLAKIERRMTLAEMRKSRKISQASVAEALGIGQMQISRLEKRKDPRLSTMQRTVAAMGGHLTMIATFPDQEPVVLVASGFAEKRKPSGSRSRLAAAAQSARPKGQARARA
ncbi:MAG: helix-turn-helix domain-containing protein [Acidobacteriaceae bacterium]